MTSPHPRFAEASKRAARGGVLARCVRGIGLPALFLAALFQLPAHAQDAAEFLLRLDRLEAENRRLNGQIEEMRFQVRRLEDQVKRFQTDTDFRFREVEGGRAGTRPVSPQIQSPQGTTAPQRRSDAFDPAANPNAPGVPRALPQTGAATPPGAPLPGGTLPPGGRLVQDDDLGTPLDVTGNRRPRAPDVPAPATPGDSKSEYDFARSLVDRGDYELSEAAFKDYLKNYPRDRRVADATFWLGESYLRRTRYREAAEQFLTVTTKHANAARAPEAMLKLGISLRGLGAKDEACGTFEQVTRKYPKASTNIRQAVDREKGRAQC